MPPSSHSRALPHGARPRARARPMRSLRAKSAASSNAPGAVSPLQQPEGRRVAADRAERRGPPAGDVEGAESAHRDPADRHPPPVGAGAPDRLGDDLVEHVARPLARAAGVEVRVVTTIGEHDDGRALALRAKRGRERGVGVRLGCPARPRPCRNTQQRPPGPGAWREQDGLRRRDRRSGTARRSGRPSPRESPPGRGPVQGPAPHVDTVAVHPTTAARTTQRRSVVTPAGVWSPLSPATALRSPRSAPARSACAAPAS